MQIATRNGNNNMLDLLSSWNGSLISRGKAGDTLFHLAAYNGHLHTMKWLHDNGIDLEAIDLNGQTAVHLAARRLEVDVLLYLYKQIGCNFTSPDFDNRTPLECIPRASISDEPEKVERCRTIVIRALSDQKEKK